MFGIIGDEGGPMSARELYDKSIKALPAVDRLRLAAMILDDLAATTGAGLDVRDDWSDEDVADLTAYSLKHASSGAL
jgi:hypothetical protein